MCFKTQIFMIWCFNLNIYALIIFWKISLLFFFFILKNVYKIATNLSQPRREKILLKQCLGCSDKAKSRFQYFRWMTFPIPRSFHEDPLRGWRSSPCKESLRDWFHVWHTFWDEDFLICGEDSCEAQVTNFFFMSNVEMAFQGNVPH